MKYVFRMMVTASLAAIVMPFAAAHAQSLYQPPLRQLQPQHVPPLYHQPSTGNQAGTTYTDPNTGQSYYCPPGATSVSQCTATSH